MKKATTIIIGIMVLLAGSILQAADFKQGEVIVKYKNTLGRSISEEEQRPYVVAVDDTKTAIEELKARDDIEYAEPNYIVEAESVPSDWPYGSSEWKDTGTTSAWSYIESSGGHKQDVVVAAIDSGVDADHPDLQDRLLPGYDYANGDSDPEDDAGHGTKVAGIIIAKANGGTDTCGLTWDVDVKILPLKFMKNNNGSTSGYVSDAISAIYAAVDYKNSHDVPVIINASWGFSAKSQSLDDAIGYANSNGILFVCSAGNDGQDNDQNGHWPSNSQQPNVIAVAAMNDGGTLASFSNYGEHTVDVAAPGVGLQTTTNDGGITSWASGTSFASPWVASVASMVYAMNPDLDAAGVKQRVLQGSIMSSSYSAELLASGGCVNAYNAVKGVIVHDVEDNDSFTPPAGSGSNGESNDSSKSKVGCFIDTSSASPIKSLPLIILITLVALFPMFRHGRQE